MNAANKKDTPEQTNTLPRFVSRTLAVIAGLAFCLLTLEICLIIIGYIHTSNTKNFRQQGDSQNRQYSVLCLGDSFTEGIGAPRGKSYPCQLQQLFDHSLPGKVSVYNRGIASANTCVILESLTVDLKTTNPDIVVIMAGWANFWNMYGFRSFAKGNTWKNTLIDNLYKIHTYKLLILLWNNTLLTMGKYPWSNCITRYPTQENNPYSKILPYNFYDTSNNLYEPFLKFNLCQSSYRVDTKKQTKGMQNYLKGQTAYNNNNMQLAEKIFRQGMNDFPKEPANFWGLAKVLIITHRPYLAEQILITACKQYPESNEFKLCLQDLYIKLSEAYPQNIDMRLRAITYFPQIRLFFDELLSQVIPNKSVDEDQLQSIKNTLTKLQKKFPLAR